MKNILFLMLTALTTLVACAQNEPQIKGHLDSLSTDTLYMMVSKPDFSGYEDEPVRIAVKNGDFTVDKKYDSLRMIYLGEKPAPGQRLFSTGVVITFLLPGEQAVVSGTLINDVVGGSQFYTELASLKKEAEAKGSIINIIKANSKKAAAAALLTEVEDSLTEALDALSPEVKNGVMAPFVKVIEAQAKEEIATRERMKNLAPGSLAPDFTLNDINGKPLSLSSLRGKPVVLDFWGSWCIWCIRGVPRMKEYYKKYEGKLEILGIDCNDTDEKWRAAVKEHNIPWLHVYNPRTSDLTELYAIQGYPTKVILDKDGKIYKYVVGEDPKFYDYLDELFK